MLAPVNPWHSIYRLASRAAMPLALARLRRNAAGHPELQARSTERRGYVPEAGGEIWLHGASAGEVNAVAPLAMRLAADGRRLVISTLTHTGALRVRSLFGGQERVRHVFAPLDTPGAVRRWLGRTRPALGLVVETEIWPELFGACQQRGISLALVNARISARAFARYRRFHGLFRPALAALELALCQTDTDAERLLEMGVPAERLRVTGNLKFDFAPPPGLETEASNLRAAWGERPVWVAGSSHAGEEELIAAAHRKILESRPDALLVLVPRHPERAGNALSSLQSAGLRVELQTTAPGARADGVPGQALVIGRMGVLLACYRAADVCFVGGSLVDRIGGHNLLEPALAGKPSITGPFVADQARVCAGLEEAGALLRVSGASSLARSVLRLFEEPAMALAMGSAGARHVESGRGAVARTLEALQELLAPG